MIFFNKHL